ncbi:non-homologous end joining protein Ku [Agilicoccus flavus]|uniref:non-homologous end joining protein Ku n=1 Tax=Agilicoccus flavus TaxID=2775968 RepID=UPI001CF6C222|nr:Ku protein [Agilicoccus flavus]
MRAIWKGAVSFGLVTVPVRLVSATENRDVKFHQVRASDGSRIRYKRVAEADGEEVKYADIAKGYDSGDGRTVILTDEDFAQAPTSSSKEIAVEKFVPADQIDPLLLEKSYYLEPDAAAVKPYALLREALRDTDRMAVVTLSLRSRTSIAVLRVRDDVIVCQTMLWPDEVRAADFPVLEDVPEPKESERSMAHMLIESMAGDFDPDDYEDDFRSAVESLVEAKLTGGEVVVAEKEDEDEGQVVDLLAALQKSVERAKAARGESGGSEADDEPATKTASKQTAAKKTTAKSAAPKKTTSKTSTSSTTAKKPAAKKTTAKKTTAKKTTAKTATKADEAPEAKAG